MDPVSLLGLAVTAYNGIKQAAKLGKEVHEIYGELSKWATHISDLNEFLSQDTKKKKPSIFKKLEFKSSETAEAFNILAARKQVEQMEADIRFMFLYGELSHLGMDGYRELIDIRREIRTQREKLIYEHQRRKRQFIHNLKIGAIMTTLLVLVFVAFYVTIQLITTKG